MGLGSVPVVQDALALHFEARMKGDASLTDLRVEDKLKIGNMLKELAKAQRQGQQAAR